ncbi:MAG: esterase/lipase family protein [Myxococcota bacterium]|jgi:pimeloyl-ACP methyl ester carboxylesterase
MTDRHHIYLIPGFFGFTNLGDLRYFAHVNDVLRDEFARRDLDVVVHPVRTWPTASVRRRAQRLVQVIAETGGDGDEPIHLIGHSSGGLDARLLVSAGASLSEDPPAERIAARVRSIVSVATPHFGTPLVSVFTRRLGGRLLQVLSLSTIYVLRYGRLPLSVAVRLGGLLVKLEDRMGTGQDVLDQLYGELLDDFSDERRVALDEFLTDVGNDQQLIPQLTPENMATFNATTRDDGGVRYGCVLARGRPPGLASTLAAGLGVYAQASHALYATIYRGASRTPHDRTVMPSYEQVQAMRAAWGEVPDPRDNDGIVPTLSQLWGEVICAVTADHHDLIGHFDDTEHDPPHYDWITSGSGFKRREFEALWASVAHWIAVRGIPSAGKGAPR